MGWVQFFNGYFSVDNNTNLVTSFYETINGSTDFNNNILIPVNQSFYGSPDNIYQSGWLQFNSNGCAIRSMSFITNPPGNYQYDLCSFGNNPATTNRGVVVNNTSYGWFNSITNILPISNPSCFNEGTKILCLNKNLEEEYIPIENLRKGDLVKSYKHGYRKIDLIGKNPMINNPDKFNECMYKMEKTEENGLLDDLIVTGGHAILVHDLGICKEENDKILGTIMIDDKYLLLSAVSKEFVKLENTNLYTYYHFILENNGNDDERFGVWANGILTETPSKNQFNNHKYTLL